MPRRFERPVWWLAALVVVVMVFWNRYQKLHDVDTLSITDRAQIHTRLDSLEVRVEHLEVELGVNR